MAQEHAEVVERRFGEAGQRFLRELPERLSDVAGRWHLTLCESLPIGIGGFLVGARTQDGRDAVLKLSPTGGEQDRVNELEAWALDRWRGCPAVPRRPGGGRAAHRAVCSRSDDRHAPR
jgi:hypothetical protein